MLHVRSAISGEPKSVRRLKEHLAAELGISLFRLQLVDDHGPVEETAVVGTRIFN